MIAYGCLCGSGHPELALLGGAYAAVGEDVAQDAGEAPVPIALRVEEERLRLLRRARLPVCHDGADAPLFVDAEPQLLFLRRLHELRYLLDVEVVVGLLNGSGEACPGDLGLGALDPEGVLFSVADRD